MNWLDIAILLLMLVSVAGSIATGLTHELIRLAALLLGILMGLWWYPEVAKYLQPYMSGPATAGFAAFFVILLAFVILGSLVSKILGALIRATGLRWFDRLLGAAFGLVRGILASAALVLAIVAFLPGQAPPRAVAKSHLAPAVLYCARAIVMIAPRKIKEGFESGLQRVRTVWREDRDDTV